MSIDDVVVQLGEGAGVRVVITSIIDFGTTKHAVSMWVKESARHFVCVVSVAT